MTMAGRKWFALVFAAAAAYVSLSQEMLWMRMVSYITGGDPSVFAHVLGVFLVGVALGALAAEKLCERGFAGAISPATFVGVMLAGSAILYWLSLGLIARLFVAAPLLAGVATYAVVCAVSFLLGGVFPVVCHWGTEEGEAVGLAVSRIYMANIVGSTLGPLLTGFVLMEYLPLERIIVLLSAVAVLLGGAALAMERRWRRWPVLLAPALAAGMVAAGGWLYQGFLERLHFQSHWNPACAYKTVLHNRCGIIAVAEDPSGMADMLYGCGMFDGTFNVDPWLNSNGIDRAYMIAALHPRPRSVLEIGLASGSWSRVIAAYEPVERHVIVEINPRYVDLVAQYAPQKDLLRDPRVEIHFDDGRRWLMRNRGEKFDLIVQNTTWHWRSQITNLLSAEYLTMCRERLNAGGVMYFNATGSEDAVYTAARVFRHVVRYRWFVAVSDSPFALAPEQVHANLLKFAFDGRAVFDESRPEYAALARRLAAHPLIDVGEALRQRRDLWLVTDDNMATEYKRRRWYDPRATWGALWGRWRSGSETGSEKR